MGYYLNEQQRGAQTPGLKSHRTELNGFEKHPDTKCIVLVNEFYFMINLQKNTCIKEILSDIFSICFGKHSDKNRKRYSFS